MVCRYYSVQWRKFAIEAADGEGRDLLAGVVVRVVQHEVGEDDLHALASVAAELVVAVERGRVRGRVAGRGERAVLLRVAPEDSVARRA